jgi:hypothetical protein
VLNRLIFTLFVIFTIDLAQFLPKNPAYLSTTFWLSLLPFAVSAMAVFRIRVCVVMIVAIANGAAFPSPF